MTSHKIFAFKRSSKITEEFANGDRLISKSFGGDTTSMLAGRGYVGLERHISTDSAISYSGYLLKRSKEPYQENTSTDNTVDIDPFDCPELPRMPGMFSPAMDRWRGLAFANPSEDDPTQPAIAVTPSPAAQVPHGRTRTPNLAPDEKTPVQQGLDAVAAFFGISIESNTTQQQTDEVSSQLQRLRFQRHSEVSQQPQKSTPIKVRGERSTEIRGSFQAAAYHRRHSAPIDMIDVEEMHNPYSPQRYYPPPNDFVDSQGHLWRGKYCVLENGILYFYRNTTDGESTEAVNERREAQNEASGNPPTFSSKDLSKSPMPRARHLASSLSDDSSGSMWEKKVHLNCVGAVRSAEQEYGPNSFELIGIDNSDETNETLVLQANSPSEMKEWIFQFHRSLASFLQNFMGAYLDLGSSVDFPQPVSQTSILLSTSPSEKKLHELMKRQQESPQLAKSLSHGHGRITVHRRRQDPHSSSPLQDCVRSESPLRSPNCSDDNVFSFTPDSDGSSSPHQFQLYMKEQSSLGSLHQSPVVSPTERVLIAPTKEIQRSTHNQTHHHSRPAPELAAPASAYPETERPRPTVTTGKYVPPHLRIKNEGTSAQQTTRYVPPHLRKQESTDPQERISRYVPPHMRAAGISQAGRLKLGEGAKEKQQGVAPAIHHFGHGDLDSLDVVRETSTPFKYGGCADPDVMDGSILDASFIPRKASKLGKVATEAFGCFGGGNPSNGDDSAVALRWETGAASECGIRDSNEDAYLIATNLLEAFKYLPQWSSALELSLTISHNLGLFALFDGHCGNQAARFAAEKLTSFVYEEMIAMPATAGFDPLAPANVETVLRKAIMKLDETFCQVCHSEGREWESGATALVALLVNGHLVIANLGDCRGILCRSIVNREAYDGSLSWRPLDTVVDDSGRRSNDLEYEESRYCFWKEVTEMHTPSAPQERDRIESANGWVTTETEIPIGQLRRIDFLDGDVIGILKRCFDNHSCYPEEKGKERRSTPQRILEISRVCGELAVSRALGDRDFKAAFNTPSADGDWWDCPLFLPPCPDESQPRKFQGDLVSNSPSFQNIRVGEAGVVDEFLLFACDGLWDVLDIDDAVRVTRDLLYRKRCTAKKAAARLTELAIHLGSSDNVTVIVVRLFSRNQKTSHLSEEPSSSDALT